MFTGMIAETPFDLRWRMFGIHCRVHPLFWLMALIFSYPFINIGIVWVLASVACIFFSILLHELGHVIVGRMFGSHGHIVLWGFGGLAIGSSEVSGRWRRMAVFAAGPAIQLLLWAALYFSLPLLFRLEEGPILEGILIVVGILLYINLFWALLNLLPIWPLDGGQIGRELFIWGSPRNGIRMSLHLSIATAGLLALHALMVQVTKRPPLVFWLPAGMFSIAFFGMFAVESWQALQIENSRDHWSDDPWN